MNFSLVKVLLNIIICLLSYLLYDFIKKNRNDWELVSLLDFKKYTNNVSTNEMLYNISKVIEKNERLNHTLDSLRKTLFFKIFKLNLEPDCNIFKQEQICRSASCYICSCENNEIPDIWRQPEHGGDPINSKIDDPFLKWTDKFTLSSKQWLLEKDIDSKEGTFVNLLKNPEGYTGYRGPHIWDAIFRENCFSDRFMNLCKEDKTFYRIFSGWLSNTNMQIGINFHNKETNKTYLNVSMITSRLLNSKERVDNLFFLYSLMIKAFKKAEPLLIEYDYHSGNKEEDEKTLALLNELFNSEGEEINYLSEAFNETTADFEYFMHSNKINELVSRFRNISSIIDCVSCSKCRMHAKLEVFGMATMLKIMFSNNYELKESLLRNELVSFVNLFAKLSKTISYIKYINDTINYSHHMLLMKYLCIAVTSFICLLFVNCYNTKKQKVDNKKQQ